MSKIFISYRRSDSQDVTGRIYDALVDHFSTKNVFKDVDSIPHGKDFRKALRQAADNAAVVIVIIGPRWLSAKNADGERRLDDPNDFVRIEVETALLEGIPIIPVTVSHAPMVAGDDLPKSLRKLAFQNGLPVRPDPDFRRDIGRLVRAIEKICPGLSNHRDENMEPDATPPQPRRGFAACFLFALLGGGLILGGLVCAGCGVGGYFTFPNHNKNDVALMQVRGTLTHACQAYAIKNNGEFPANLNDLMRKDRLGSGPYLESGALIDPWGKPYLYDRSGVKNNGEKPDIWAVAPDGTMIGNWRKNN